MLTNQFPVHYFHAHGVGFGGEITRPFQAVIESQAATAISSVGGFASATAGPFNFKDIIQFQKASTQVIGAEGLKTYDTMITCRLEGINILNQFTADEIVAHLVVTTQKDGSGMTFNTLGSRFVNLRIGGALIHPVLDHECKPRVETPPVQKPSAKDSVKAPDATYATGKIHPVYDLSQEKGKRTQMKGSLTTLVAEPLKVPGACFDADANAIHVPDFGVVYLAEYLVTPYGRQLNMFRVKLGCGTKGNGSGSGVGGNGSTTGM